MLTHVDLVGDTALHHAVTAGDKGLAVCKYLLEQHQRKVRLENAANAHPQGPDESGDGAADAAHAAANSLNAQLFSMLRRRNAAGQCALDIAIDVQPYEGASKTQLIAWLVDNQVRILGSDFVAPLHLRLVEQLRHMCLLRWIFDMRR